MQIIDNNEVNWTMHRSAHGFSCNTCIYYGLPVQLSNDEVPTTRRDIDDEDLALVIKVNPNIMGFCTVFEGAILINVPNLDSCNRYIEKPTTEQFVDDGIK